MGRRGEQRRPRSLQRRRRGRLFLAFERAVLGVGMSVVAFFIERRLIKAIKKGGVKPAPRTAAERDEAELGGPQAQVREGELTTSPQKVGDQAHR